MEESVGGEIGRWERVWVERLGDGREYGWRDWEMGESGGGEKTYLCITVNHIYR